MGEALHITGIRTRRPKPGLRPQHLRAIEACAELCQGRLEGAQVGSREIRFFPGRVIKGGEFHWDIGTAGSTTMLLSALLPLALFAEEPSVHRIEGGLFQDFAPSAFHMQHVLFPLLREMGAEAELRILQPGYPPRGGGRIEATVLPLDKTLAPVNRKTQGTVRSIRGIALSSGLRNRNVSDRMAEPCRKRLSRHGYSPALDILYDERDHPVFEGASLQRGAALAIWAETDTGCRIGSDMAGELRRSAESIGERTAQNLLDDLATGATVDRHLADQIVPFAALAQGRSEYRIPCMTDHIESRLWLAGKILGAGTEAEGNRVTIEGIGYRK